MAIAAFKLSRKAELLVVQVRDIIAKLITNILVYATPNPTTATLTTLVNKLDTSRQAALRGGTDRTTQMNLDKEKVMENMTALLGYVQTTSGGDAEKINLVAYVRKNASPVGLLPAPSNVRSVFGEHDGEIIFRWLGVKGRKLYTMQLNDTPGDDTKWENLDFTGKQTYTAKGLISGKEYAFRIATISTAGISGWSDETTHKAL